MMSRYQKWAQKEHPEWVKIVALIPAGLIIVILIPWLIVRVGPAVDARLGLPASQPSALSYLLGGILAIMGLACGLWSVWTQLTRGRGTPLPMLPTQELLTRGPFRYCRNPMTLGTVLFYVGLAVCVKSVAGLGLAVCIAAGLIFYLKRFEEKELVERFGAPYEQYKREVPFIIPRIPKRR